jgi:putative DeoR family transcriptional regulator (stage III sporulation protein D)
LRFGGFALKYDRKRGYMYLKGYIEERAVELARYIIEKRATVRAAAKKFGISKSTVHKDVTERLMKIKPEMADDVKAILDENKAERHIRGGEATKAKYQGGNIKAG